MVDRTPLHPRARRRGMPGAPRRRDPEATRRALLAAGTRLFAERGYDGVPVSAIADRAAVNKAMFSQRFGGQRELDRAIVTSPFAAVVERGEVLPASARTQR